MDTLMLLNSTIGFLTEISNDDLDMITWIIL